jgi:hypothetical protein
MTSTELTHQQFRSLSATRRASYMFGKGVRWGFDGNVVAIPFLAANVAMSQRGERLSTAAGSVAGMGTFGISQGVIAAGLSLIPGIGQGAVLFASMLGAMYPSALVDSFVSRQARTLTDIGRNIRRLETGAGFTDSETAARSRLGAVMEMSAAMQTSRRYLGQEARLMHR